MSLPRLPDDQVPWDALAAYLAGELADEEQARMQEWLAADERHGELLALLRQGWNASGASRRRYDAEAALRWIKRQPVRAAEPASRSGSAPRFRETDLVVPSRRSGGLRWAALAASVALAVAGGWWWTSREAGGAMPRGVEIGAFTEYRTAPGQRLTVKLADGSSATLAPASTLRIGTAYARGRAGVPREAELVGEAYFEIVHDGARPFSVRTDGALVRDLGTRFVVQAYPEARGTEVVVTEGLAAIGKPAVDVAARGFAADSLLVRPGQRGLLGVDGTLALSSHADLDESLGWTEGRLVFHRTLLPDALRRISRWYGVPIHLADSAFAGRTLDATFRDEPVSEVMRLVAVTFGLRVDRDGNAFVLRPNVR